MTKKKNKKGSSKKTPKTTLKTILNGLIFEVRKQQREISHFDIGDDEFSKEKKELKDLENLIETLKGDNNG